MAFDSGIQVELNGSTGSDTANGGGFSPACTGFATDLAATVATGTAPVVTSASYNFAAGDIGAYLFVQAGTNWIPGWYPIASVAANAATLTATIGSAVLYNQASANNTAAGCATTASPTGGTWGIDYSRSASPRISYTDMVIGASSTLYTSVGNPVGPNVVGNVIAMTSGASFTTPQWVQVVSVSSTVATVDKSLGTPAATGGHGGLGGCIATPGKVSAIISGTNNSFVAVVGGNTYNMTSSSNVAGGRITLGQNCIWFGYSSPSDRYPYNFDATRPVFQSTGSNSFSLITIGNPNIGFHSIDFENGNSNTGIKGFDDTAGWGQDTLWHCKFNGLATGAIVYAQSVVDYCWFNGCTTDALTCGASVDRNQVRNSVFTSNTRCNITMSFYYACVFYANGYAGTTTCSVGRCVERCLFHSQTGGSGNCVQGTTGPISNSIFWNNTGTASAAAGSTSDFSTFINNCAFGSNTQDTVPSSTFPGYRVLGKIVLTADPCTNAAAGDFSLNNAAGGGALLKALGFPTTFANGLTTNALDLGPAQHAAGAAGGACKLAGSGGGRAG